MAEAIIQGTSDVNVDDDDQSCSSFRVALSEPNSQEKLIIGSSSSSASSSSSTHEEPQVVETQHIPITPLDPTALLDILARLPDVHHTDEDGQDDEPHAAQRADAIHLVRDVSLAPPNKPGMLLSTTPFPPPPDDRAEQPFDLSLPHDLNGQEEIPPLSITRFTPAKAAVDHALTSISLTFSQPMVALSSITDVEVDTRSLPISLSPQVDGTWRWLGTNTVQFQAKHRLPFSTTFVLTVAEGCKSSLGGTLRSRFFHTFSTSPPRVVKWSPMSTPKSLSPLFLLCFDQRISPPTVLSHIFLGLKEDAPVFRGDDFEVVEEDLAEREWPDINLKELAGTWVAFKLRDKLLEKSTSYVLSVPCGCRSAEGSLKSREDWSMSFTTYGPLVILHSHRNSSFDEGIVSKPCWELRFSNALDHRTVSKSAIHISPSIENFKVKHTEGSSSILIEPILNSNMPDAPYVVTLEASLKDAYGQHLDPCMSKAEFKPRPLQQERGFLMGPAAGMVILNPSRDPIVSFTVFKFSSLRIQVFQVDVDNYGSPDLPSNNTRDYAEGKNCAVGKKVYDQEVGLGGEAEQMHEHEVPLGSFLQHKEERLGQLLVLVEPTEGAWRESEDLSRSYNDRDVVCIWVQSTKLSVDVFPDKLNGSYTAWISSLESGVPVSRATVKVGCHKQETDEQGLAVIPADGGNRDEMLVAQNGADVVFMPKIWNNYNDTVRYGWYVFDSRGLYKPTEEVHIKGYLRKLEQKNGGGQQPVFAKGHVSYTVHDARGNKLTEGDAPINDYGSFFFIFIIPGNSNLGNAIINFEYKAESKQESSHHQHRVKVQEFRKPEFEIMTTHWAPSSALYSHPVQSSFVVASTSAKYYTGEPVTSTEVRWNIKHIRAHYVPPGHLQYSFGSHYRFSPWGYGSPGSPSPYYPAHELTGKTDMDGKHDVKIQFTGVEDHPSCISVSAKSWVIDINNQVQVASTTFLVHPSSQYVGFKLRENFGRKGEETKGEVIVCDVEGKLVEGVEVKVMISGRGKQEEEDDAGLVVYDDVSDEQFIIIKSDVKPVEFGFIPILGGGYSLVFSVVDEEQRHNESRLSNFFVGGGYMAAGHRFEEFVPKDRAQVMLNKVMYEAGERAVVLIQSPFWPAEGLLLMRCCDTHVGEKVRFCMLSNTHTLTTAILDASWIPVVEVQVLLLGSTSYTSSNGDAEGQQLSRPAFAVGQGSIKISSSFHRLLVDITPLHAEEAATPGGTVHVSLKVTKESSREGVGGAEVSLIVVDEAILATAKYNLRDPLSSFYPAQRCDMSAHHLRKHCLLPESYSRRRRIGRRICRKGMLRSFASNKSSRAMALCRRSRDASDDNLNTISARSNFNPLAAFIPFCITDRAGLAEVEITLPDNLTRYRIWAVATTETQFGFAESSLMVHLPVMIRPSPPRFLYMSDYALISMVLQNQTKHSLPLAVGMRTTSPWIKADTAGYSLTLPGSQRVVLSFPVLAVDVGKACLQFVASTMAEVSVPVFSDAIDVVVPIYTPVSTELFATYGDMAEHNIVQQPVKCPPNVFPGFGGLEVSISSTTLQSLTDALLYLYTYPFECNEQVASRMISLLSLWEVLEAFKVKDMPSEEEIRNKLNADLGRLRSRQLSCGGWSWWTKQGNAKHQPFISLHVAHALVKASKLEVWRVDTEMLEKAMDFCAGIETYISEEALGYKCLEETKHALVAYALYVQALSNKDVGTQASDLLKKTCLDQLSLEACGWLLIVLGLSKEKRTDDIRLVLEFIKTRVLEAGEYVHFMSSYKDDGMSVMLHSNHRTDAILLEAFLITEPTSTLCAKLAKGLQAHRKAGKWSSTQENCFILVALSRFFAVYEGEEPNFRADVWLGERWVTSHTYAGRSIETKQAKLPMPVLRSDTVGREMTPLILQKNGRGCLYYRIGLQYAPLDLHQKAASYGFSIKRVYEGIDSPEHAEHDITSNLWKFKVGERVRVKLTLGTTVKRYHVAMVDWLPAGCESVNPALEKSVMDCQWEDSGGRLSKSWSGRWVEHENMRDERVEAFCTMLGPGQYKYSYVVRATCKGEFVIPPAKVEEMYTPENFGRCATEKVVIG